MEERFHKTKHFLITRLDDTVIDFSFGKYLSPNLNEPIKLFKATARESITDQIVSFRDSIGLNRFESCSLFLS